jgi:hypothetical protein
LKVEQLSLDHSLLKVGQFSLDHSLLKVGKFFGFERIIVKGLMMKKIEFGMVFIFFGEEDLI